MKRTVCVGLSWAMLAAAAPAYADEPRPDLSAPVTDRVETVNYRYMILGADAAALSVVLAGYDVPRNRVVMGIGAAAFVSAAPMIHWAHGNRRGAALSFAARVVLPAAGVGLLRLKTGGADHGLSTPYGIMLGVGAAMVVDQLTAKTTRVVRAPKVQPGFALTGDGIAVSLSGAF